MAGIYIHIPFCKKACHYCNFHFSTSKALMPELITSLLKEMALQQGYIQEPVSTIYFGGGTPSLLTAENLKLLLDTLYKTYKVETGVEITLEANPDDITQEKLEAWRQLGINRLSIGIQSFFEEDLKWMNRAHNSGQAIECIQSAKMEGFNISIDLIYGTPTLTDERWYENVQRAILFDIPHLSCYALTVEHKTALERMIRQQKVPEIDADRQARHFELLMSWMNDAGYRHYEISNFAKTGFESKHNSSYWEGKPYIGLGPSAHSFNGYSRQWNVANNALYIKGIDVGTLITEVEQLTPVQQLNEYIMTSLRTDHGLSLKTVEHKWGSQRAGKLRSSANKYMREQSMTIDNDHLKLTFKGKLLADGIAADLFE